MLLLLTLVLPLPGGDEPSQEDDPIQVRRLAMPGYVSLIVQNRHTYDVTVALTVISENMRTTRLVPEASTVAANSEAEVIRVAVVDAGRPWRWRYRFRWTKGRVDCEHDDETLYRLPFESGRSYRVSQSHNGRLTHHGPNQYAVDFAMREGTTICAAREGVVVDLKENSKLGGPKERYTDLANFVSIAHPDGTIGEYHHLQFEGVLVEIGDRVQAGQALARSGNTGYSTLPHLHFGVYSAADAERMQSHPFTFDTAQGPIREPREGRTYTAK